LWHDCSLLMHILTNTATTVYNIHHQLKAKLKESESNVRTLQQQLADIEKEKHDREALIDESLVAQAKKKISKGKKDHGQKEAMLDSTAAERDGDVCMQSSWSTEVKEFHHHCQEKQEQNRAKMSKIEREKKKFDVITSSAKCKAMQEWDNSSSEKSVGGDEEEEVFTIQKFVKCRIQQGIAEIQVMWEGSNDITWEPEENLRADLGDKMVDKMMMEMRKMQQQKMVSVMMRMTLGTVVHT